MKLLLDTHIILWALTNDSKLPQKAGTVISQSENKIWYSTASVWEVMIKHLQHPEHMPISGRQLSKYCQEAGYQMLPVRDEHVYALEGLRRKEGAPPHKDPFDCIMIAQAKVESMMFMTHDYLLPYYMEECIISV
ncbi:MAG: type II toxin-antitoxin system VapC family toxin [Roseburia sp.]|nr:type II toxin-antitoxin system VapC family toxin [Roseburia sp.]